MPDSLTQNAFGSISGDRFGRKLARCRYAAPMMFQVILKIESRKKLAIYAFSALINSGVFRRIFQCFHAASKSSQIFSNGSESDVSALLRAASSRPFFLAWSPF